MSESEVLALRPVRLAQWSETEAGDGTEGAPGTAAVAETEAEAEARVTIERPLPPVHGLRSLLARISALTGAKRLRLDEHGSFVWRRMDGEHDVEELAEALREAFGAAVEPAGERVALFLRSLDRENLVELRDPSGAPVKLGRT